MQEQQFMQFITITTLYLRSLDQKLKLIKLLN